MNKPTEDRPKGKGGLLFVLAGFVLMQIVGWVVFPALLYSSKDQPVGFSHKKHLATGMECAQCHAFRDDGTYAGLPNIQSDVEGACIACHDNPKKMQGADPREQAFLNEYIAKGKTRIEWLSYSKQPPCVFFPHSAHVKKAKLDCAACHGDKKNQDAPPVYKENRLTGYSIDIWGRNISGLTSHPWESMKMSDCARCHTERQASNACFVCHK